MTVSDKDIIISEDKCVIKNPPQVISCGGSERDTVIFTSIDRDGAVVSLQRGIVNVLGEKVEPFERKVTFEWNDMEPQPVLTAMCALICCGLS
ncbi:hypothetical protein FACS1894105_09960 [Clostridia bacterium]|nr:hypothetical protein FACS1894105_09960 [Clostridia bacterium]